MRPEELGTYELIQKREIADLNSVGYILRHKKTGARVCLLQNEDENKVFSIGFRTPPENSTGVAHILEHSVLEGSEKFPVKDPFIELAKGSLNTFLNAMTYPDKTVYPVASCNDKDFRNLMDVYLDAVFHPFIYERKNIFLQEGWHYELRDKEDELTINGVVYNEMKGAFSSVDDVLEREIMNSLYPDTSYGYESGGDPDVIPELTYEQFLQFHRRYYHPSNSYIYLYGNLDMADTLDFIDREYLCHYEEQKIDSEIKAQKPFEQMREIVKEYPIGEEESEEENTYLTLNYSVSDSLNREHYIAFQILDYALCSAPGAPLKEALIHKGIGKDVYSIYENGIKQPYFSIVSKCAKADQKEDFLDTINSELTRLSENGLDHKALLAGLNYYEFKYREADFGSYPKGLMYGLQIMDSWLYEDSLPFLHVEANQTFADLKAKVEESYFEDLMKTMLVKNPHKTFIRLAPVKGLTAQREQALGKKLEALKQSMSEAELEAVIRQTKELERWQEEEDTPEALARIPMLKREDIGKKAMGFCNELKQLEDTKILFHPLFTNGIAYIRLIFDLGKLTEEEFRVLGLFKGILGLLNTEHYTYGELYNEMNLKTGGMAAVNNVYGWIESDERYTATLELKVKVLYEMIPEAFRLFEEIMLTSDFSDAKRIREILAEGKSRMQGQMMSAGHSVAVNRALSYESVVGELNEILSGVTFYKKVEEWEKHFEQYSDYLCNMFKQLAHKIFRAENLMVDYVAEEKEYDRILPCVQELKGHLYREPLGESLPYKPVPVKKQEGFKSASQVQYVAVTGNFRKRGLPYTGALKVLKVMLGYDYLWNQVRVKGGAYGCMCSFGKSGFSYFVSYRDPNLKNTLEVYQKAPEYIRSFEADERVITQFIISAIGELDTPMSAAARGLFSLSGYMTGVTNEMLQQERDEILETTGETLRDCSRWVSAFVEDPCICVMGGTEKIEQAADVFEQITPLFEN